MRNFYFATIAIFASVFSSCSQSAMHKYEGNWEGTLPNMDSFSFNVKIKMTAANQYQVRIANTEAVLDTVVASRTTSPIELDIQDNMTLTLSYTEDKTALTGFIRSGVLMYHLVLNAQQDGIYSGTWNPFMVDQLLDRSIYLSVEINEDGSFATYPFFGDQRFTGTWCGGFTKENSVVSFRDFKTGLRFRAKLQDSSISLEVLLAGATIASTALSRSTSEWEFEKGMEKLNMASGSPNELNDGWAIGNSQEQAISLAPLEQLADSVLAGKLENTHSVLIARQNSLVFEAYFEGYHANIPHDQRSASKSISSAIVGIGIEEGLIKDVNERLIDFLPDSYQYSKDSLKAAIRIKDLLTMSSGLDVNEKASEGAYQSSGNWLETVMEAPMVDPPGTRGLYGSANPYLLGVCLDGRLEQPMALYMDQKLLAPLGITNYIIQTDNTGATPYFGGGMYLTPRDMLKFGQLYLNSGLWEGRQVVPKDWANASFQKHTILEDTNDKNAYGYQWWHNTYSVNSTQIHAIEARGNGGQYIFVLPQLEAVVVITSGNYRNGSLLQQPEHILEEYVLKALLPQP